MIVAAVEAMLILGTLGFFYLFLFLASPEDNGIVLEKEISKEEVIGIIELYKRTSAATETAQLQNIVLQMDKYGVRGNSVGSHLQEREVCQGHFMWREKIHLPLLCLLGAELEGLCSSTEFAALEKQQLLLAYPWQRLVPAACKLP